MFPVRFSHGLRELCAALMITAVGTAAPAATATDCSLNHPATGLQTEAHPTGCDITLDTFFYSRASAGGSWSFAGSSASADVTTHAESVTNVEDSSGDSTASSSVDFSLFALGARRPGRIS